MELRIIADPTVAVRDLERGGRAIGRAIEEGADDATTLWLREMRLYPPQRPPANPKKPYKRTDTLKGSWQKRALQRQGNTVIGMVVSSGMVAPYNVWVQHAPMQARIHRGVWRNTDEGVVERTRAQVTRMAQERLRRALAGLAR